MQSGSEWFVCEAMKNESFMSLLFFSKPYVSKQRKCSPHFPQVRTRKLFILSNVCTHRKQYCTKEKPHYAPNDMFESQCILHELPQP